VTLKTPEKIRELQRKLYRKAKQEPTYRFYLLYDKVYRRDILSHAYRLVKANKGVCGVDGLTFESIEEREGGAERYLEQIAEELKGKSYRPMPVRRVYIPKPDGKQRPLGILTIKDRGYRRPKLVIEPTLKRISRKTPTGLGRSGMPIKRWTMFPYSCAWGRHRSLMPTSRSILIPSLTTDYWD
jgi:hypothetical protein